MCDMCSVYCTVLIFISYSVTQDDTEYNALEHDLAVVNLYFGSSTVYGQHSVYSDIFKS